MNKFRSKLFKWMFSFVALLPLRLKFDEDYDQLESFAFSFSYPETWWYILVLVLQLSFTVEFNSNIFPEIKNHLDTAGHTSTMWVINWKIGVLILWINLFFIQVYLYYNSDVCCSCYNDTFTSASDTNENLSLANGLEDD